MNDKSNKNHLVVRLGCFLAAASAVFLTLTLAAYFIGVNQQSVQDTQNIIESNRWYLTFMRVSLIAGFWYFWPLLGHKIFHADISNYKEKRATFLLLRNNLLIGFIAIELLIAQNLAGYLLGMIF